MSVTATHLPLALFLTVCILGRIVGGQISAQNCDSSIRGVDVSSTVSVDQWKCIKRDGWFFAIIRIYRKVGDIDGNAADTIKNARTGGFSNVDGYIWPCTNHRDCPSLRNNPKEQVRQAIQNLRQNNADVDRIWIDVEQEPGKPLWSADTAWNVNFIQELVTELVNHSYRVGIYTQKSKWIPITGDTKLFGHLPLWYAHYDNRSDFSDFRPFGGWGVPTMKQYRGSIATDNPTVCGVEVDMNIFCY